MGLIIPENVLRDIIAQMPQIDYGGSIGNRDIQFGWGDKKELNKYLALKKDDSYPLIWLLSPETERHINNSTMVERDCSVVVATLEVRTDLYNPQRYVGSFDTVLNPIADLFIQGVRSSSLTRILDNNPSITKFPNYSDDANSDKNGTIELWDALRIDCQIEFKDGCLKQITWITN